ncbi:MAG: PAS domain-containing protein [Eubacteriales bacterium]|nr:PAS domain-containing protein [Eubacteriales bacterium]
MSMQDNIPNLDLEKMKYILSIKEAYEQGELSLEEAQAKLRERVSSIKPYEIALAEQKLEAYSDDQCQKEDIQQMLKLYQGLYDTSRPELPFGHPLNNYYAENAELEKLCLAIEDLVQYPVIKNQWYELYDKLHDYRIHLARKQNQLYPVLEQKGFDRPSTTMWTLDDFIRDEIKELRELIDTDEEEFIAQQATLVADLRDLISKEEQVLYPTSLVLIPEAEFEVMKEGDREIGYAWIDPEQTELAVQGQPDSTPAYNEKSDAMLSELLTVFEKYGVGEIAAKDSKLKVAQGELTLEQINLIYKHLPVDLSYVDENEIVRFYSDTAHRVFPRSKNVIGRDVKNCHPRKSVHIVEEIIEKFRSGEQDTAEFWINKPDLFIYIFYTAVRDDEGKFRGVLEMMQDCTHIRSLKGSQTLLNWGKAEPAEENAEISSQDTPAKEANNAKAKFVVDIENISAETRLKDLLADYPSLKDDLVELSPAFKMLKTPLARIMIPKAKVADMAERSGLELEEILTGLKRLIARYQ